MAHYKVEESSLTMVADAIRERAGTSEPLVFPEGFKSAVEGIPDPLRQRIEGTLVEYESDTTKDIPQHAFGKLKSLQKITFPNTKTIGMNAFTSCSNLYSVNLDRAEVLGAYAFESCNIEFLDLKSARRLEGRSLAINPLKTLIVRNNAVVTLANGHVLAETPIANGDGYIYVPKSLVGSYKSATNWSNYAESQFRAIEDYPEITGGAV